MNKIFIIGLPRTATTSVCFSMLALGFTVAHTAYTYQSFEKSQVIADTPVFCDYQALDVIYPDAQYIYLYRDLSLWLPSIKQLLLRMYKNVVSETGGFNPAIKRCYQTIFSPFTFENINDDKFLTHCFQKHQKEVEQYFAHRQKALLKLDICVPGSYARLLDFLGVESNNQGFSQLNVGGKVTAWNQVKSERKIASTNKGRVDAIEYQHLVS